MTISATSMTVTATASTSEPNGSPTRCATTSAWCTAASTAPASTTATTITTMVVSPRPQTSTNRTAERIGTSTVQSRHHRAAGDAADRDCSPGSADVMGQGYGSRTEPARTGPSISAGPGDRLVHPWFT